MTGASSSVWLRGNAHEISHLVNDNAGAQFLDGPGRREGARFGLQFDSDQGIHKLTFVAFCEITTLVIRALADRRTTMKHFVLSIALSALVTVAVSATAQAAYYHHRHYHYWYHGGGGSYWDYYRTSWPGRGTDLESTR